MLEGQKGFEHFDLRLTWNPCCSSPRRQKLLRGKEQIARRCSDERSRRSINDCKCFQISSVSSGQIIATSHDLTLHGGLGREIRVFQGNLGCSNIIIWPDQ